MSISPIFWIANTFFVCYFKSMGQAYIKYLDSEMMKKECLIKTLIWTIGLLQIYSIIADDFIILFVSGYIFEDIEFIMKNLPTLDFIMTLISEQINPLNALFIVVVLHYFAKISGINLNEDEFDDDNNNAGLRETMMLETENDVRITEINDISKKMEKENEDNSVNRAKSLG